ncbi:MAG: RNA polymerase sigma factor [Anaerolineae bacterium]|nr:RNA polymerase sigma factor [Anaerolineae bacterium]
MKEQLPDFQAITRLKQGDLAGLDALIARYQLRALRAVYLIVRDSALAEDIVQDAFIRLAQKISQFDDARPFAPWFLRIVLNDALKATQRQKRQISLDGCEAGETAAMIEAITDPQPDPETLIADAETCHEVWLALDCLLPEQRAVIVQRYYLGYSEAEMSIELRRPPGTIKWLLHAARQRLRSLLATFDPTRSEIGVCEEE